MPLQRESGDPLGIIPDGCLDGAHWRPSSNDQPVLHLGYWNVRGIAAPIRMLLAYVGLPYVNVMYRMRHNDPAAPPPPYVPPVEVAVQAPAAPSIEDVPADMMSAPAGAVDAHR